MKARDIIPGWPRGRSSSSLQRGPEWIGPTNFHFLVTGDLELSCPSPIDRMLFMAERDMEEEYQRRQQEMTDHFRHWLWLDPTMPYVRPKGIFEYLEELYYF